MAAKAIRALVNASVQVAPSGKQNSFASRARASYILAEKGTQQPRSLSVAFLNPINDTDQVNLAIKALEKQMVNMDAVYGDCADSRHTVNVEKAEGTLASLLDFVSS